MSRNDELANIVAYMVAHIPTAMPRSVLHEWDNARGYVEFVVSLNNHRVTVFEMDLLTEMLIRGVEKKKANYDVNARFPSS